MVEIIVKTITNNNNDDPNNGNNNILLAIGMLILGYILGSIDNNNINDNNASSSSYPPTNFVVDELLLLMNNVLPQFVDVVLVPFYSLLVVIYFILRLTILRDGGIFYHHPSLKFSTKNKQQQQQQQKKKIVTVLPSQQQQQPSDTVITTTTCQRIDMTGGYQLIENHNFDELLQVQGVPWALRKAVEKLRPIHRFTHDLNTNMLTIKIEGIIETQTTYNIGNNESIYSEVRGRKFYDTLEYINGGIQTYKQAIDDGYTVTIQRILTNNKQKLTMTSVVNFDDQQQKQREPVKAIQIFERLIDEDEVDDDDDEGEDMEQ